MPCQVPYKYGGATPGGGGGSGTTTSQGVADYVVGPQAGGGFIAKSQTGGTDYTHATDAANVVQSAITALGTAGGEVVLSGALAWGSVPALPKGITGKLRIRGLAGAKVTLSAAGPRFLDFNKTADYDTFQNIELRDLLIDVNNVGGRHHVVIGTYVTGVSTTRISVQNMLIDNIRTINVPVDPATTNHRLNVWIVPDNPAGSTATTLNNIYVDRVRFEGGNMGIVIGATGAAAANCVMDEVHLDRWWHSLLAVQAAFFSSSHVQLGASATVGHVTVRRGYGSYSGDVGVEIDNALLAEVESCVMDDCFNFGFYFTNFVAPATQDQVIQFKSCKARKLTSTGACTGFGTYNNVGSHGKIQLIGCVWEATAPTFTGYGFESNVAASSFEFLNCRFVREALNTSANNVVTRLIQVAQPSGNSRFLVDNCDFLITGTVTGTPTGVQHTAIGLNGGNFLLDIQRSRFSVTVAGTPSGSTHIIYFGTVSATTISGRIRACVFSNTIDAGLNTILVQTTATLPTGQLVVSECDFSGIFGAREIIVATAATKDRVRSRNNIWRIVPVPVGMTGLVSNTGQTLRTIWPAVVVFTPGSGAGITAIDYSTNGGTTWTNTLTQAAGAMPAGVALPIGPLPTDAQIRVVFATTQPTITLVPAEQ